MDEIKHNTNYNNISPKWCTFTDVQLFNFWLFNHMVLKKI